MSGDLALVRDLEEMTVNAVPALTASLVGRWLVRTAGGVTGRANSAIALGRDCAQVGAVFGEIADIYARNGLPVRFRLTPLAPVGTADALADMGFHVDSPTLTQIADVETGRRADPAVRLDAMSDPAWLAAYALAAGRFGPPELAILAQMHRNIMRPAAFARIECDGEIIAHGYGVLDRGWVSLHEIGVAPSCRRQGLGQRIVDALLAWGAAQGARRSWLHVVDGNAPARAMYAAMGYKTAYEYVYWLP